jgi:hypothetical protein
MTDMPKPPLDFINELIVDVQDTAVSLGRCLVFDPIETEEPTKVANLNHRQAYKKLWNAIKDIYIND